MPPISLQLKDIEIQIGKRLRSAREAAGLSLDQLSAGMGVTPQQLSNYERGVHRLSAAALFNAAHFMSLPVTALYPEPTRLHSKDAGARFGNLIALQAQSPAVSEAVWSLIETLTDTEKNVEDPDASTD